MSGRCPRLGYDDTSSRRSIKISPSFSLVGDRGSRIGVKDSVERGEALSEPARSTRTDGIRCRRREEDGARGGERSVGVSGRGEQSRSRPWRSRALITGEQTHERASQRKGDAKDGRGAKRVAASSAGAAAARRSIHEVTSSSTRSTISTGRSSDRASYARHAVLLCSPVSTCSFSWCFHDFCCFGGDYGTPKIEPISVAGKRSRSEQ